MCALPLWHGSVAALISGCAGIQRRWCCAVAFMARIWQASCDKLGPTLHLNLRCVFWLSGMVASLL